MLAVALKLAAHGLAVFPVAGDCRTPLVKHGCHDSTKAADGARALWRSHPAANVSVACGAVSGAWVLDVDVKGADGVATLKALVADHGGLPRSWLSRTPSGGFHIWLSYTPGLRNKVGFAPGLDVRTDGGSVCAPASVRRDGCYAWVRAPWTCKLEPAPTWLLSLIAPPPAPPRPVVRPVNVRSLDKTARYVAAALDGEATAVAATGPGSRNARLFQAAARIGELVGAGLCPEALATDTLTGAAHACRLVQADGAPAVAATIKSGLARGMAQPREVAL